jgi:hypothetical protein
LGWGWYYLSTVIDDYSRYNGPGYIAKELQEHLDQEFGMEQIHGKPMHPQTQGKIERYHESLKTLTPCCVYFGKGEKILKKREELKEYAMKERKKNFKKQVVI